MWGSLGLVLALVAARSVAGAQRPIETLGAGGPKPGTGHVPLVVSVASGVMEEGLVKRVEPLGPAEAKGRPDGCNGTVVLRVRISKQGVPVAVHVVQGLRADCDGRVRAAVRQWRWRPYLLNGYPVAVKTMVNLRVPAC